MSRSRRRLSALNRRVSSSSASFFWSRRVMRDFGALLPRNFSSALSTDSFSVMIQASLFVGRCRTSMQQDDRVITYYKPSRRKCDCATKATIWVFLRCRFKTSRAHTNNQTLALCAIGTFPTCHLRRRISAIGGRSWNMHQRAGRTARQSGDRTGTIANVAMAPMRRPKIAEVMAPASHGSRPTIGGTAARAASLMTWTVCSGPSMP